MDFEEETGRDLFDEVFREPRDYLVEEFDLDTSTQRMDTTFIEANIKNLSRIDLVAKVLHTFLTDLPEDLLEDLPGGMAEFADREADNLFFSYEFDPDEDDVLLEASLGHASWLLERFEGEAPYCDFYSNR